MDVVESLELGKPYLLRVTDGKRTWKIPAYEVTDKTLRAIVFDPKSKKLKCLDDIERDVRFIVKLSLKMQHGILHRARDGIYIIHLRCAAAASEKYQELVGEYVLAYNENLFLKIKENKNG